jgi:hypothetical protein
MKRLSGFAILVILIFAIGLVMAFALNFNWIALFCIIGAACLITALLYFALYLIHS